jgi:hypothetical protein
MKGFIVPRSILLLTILLLVFSQLVEAQRSRSGASSSRDTFIPLSPQYIQDTVNFLGVELGQSLQEVNNNIRTNGGELVWAGSPDPNFVRDKKYLQRGNASYFRYVVHSTQSTAKQSRGNMAIQPFSREDVVLTLDVYPIGPGDMKDPQNLIVYRIQSSLSFQPSHLQLRQAHINPVKVFYPSFHALMEHKGHYLYQSGPLLVYKKGAKPSISIGDLSGKRSAWQKILPKQFPCNDLMILANDFPKAAAGMVNTTKIHSQTNNSSALIFIPWTELINQYKGEGAAQAYKACGHATVIQMHQATHLDAPDKAPLSSIIMSYQSAQILEDAYEGFFKALYQK